MKIIFYALALMLIASCKKNESHDNFTLKSGVKLLSISDCLNDDSPSNFVRIDQKTNEQIININWYLSCESNLSDPYVTLPRNNMQTLVIKGLGNKNSCECRRSIEVQVKDRIGDNRSMYVVINEEVVAHETIKFK